MFGEKKNEREREKERERTRILRLIIENYFHESISRYVETLLDRNVVTKKPTSKSLAAN